MAKDSYWFKHDSSAGRGLKLRKIQHIYGHEGKGLYWDIIEILREQDNYEYECNESAFDLLCSLVSYSDRVRFNNWFNDCVKYKLFKKTETHFFSEILCKNMEIWETKKSNGNKGGRPKITESETESKPKVKPNQNHKIIEDKIIEKEHAIQVWVNTNCPNILKLKNQLTFEQAEKLLIDYPNPDFIKSLFLAMENYKELTKKSISVNLTFRNWSKREKPIVKTSLNKSGALV